MESFHSKVLLFGEYTLMHRSMALIMPCERFSGQLIFPNEGAASHYAVHSNEYLKKFAAFIAEHMDDEFVLEVKRFEREIENGLFFQSTIPQGYGLGSSGALVVAIFLRYLKKAKEFKDGLKGLTREKIQKLKSILGQLESFFHGTSSGLDPLSIILREPLLFTGPGEVVPATLPELNKTGENHIFLLNTGITRRTGALMEMFQQQCQSLEFKKKVEGELVELTNHSIQSLLGQNQSAFYESVRKLASFQASEMSGFIPDSFRKLVQQGIEDETYFLKLCGAGGGGFILGFTKEWEKTVRRLKGCDLEVIYQY